MLATLCNEAQQLSGQIGCARDVRFSQPGPMDQKSLTDHFANLSREDLRFRFGSPVSESWVDNYAARLLKAPGQVLAAWSEGNIYALGELRPAHRCSEEACEIALSVLEPYRNQGLGTALLNALLQNAKTTGFAYAHFQVLFENRPMRRICKGKQAECTRFGPELVYSIRIAPRQM